MPESTDGIDLAGLTVRRGGDVILDGLTAALTERRIGIIGRNGSGKSTLARAIAGLQKVQAGRVRVDGLDPVKDRRGMLDRLGILFQNPDHQIFMPTVSEEMAFGLIQTGRSKAEAAQLVAQVLADHGRGDWAERPVTALSEGQRRFLCLMSVIAMAPATILLDEPFAGLDLPTQWHLESWLARLPQRLVLITHDPRNLTGYDRVIWLDDGRIAADGPPSEVTERYIAAMRARVDTC